MKWKVLFLFATVVLSVSAVMDMLLWLTAGFMVPSWTISMMDIGLILSFIALYHYIRRDP